MKMLNRTVARLNNVTLEAEIKVRNNIINLSVPSGILQIGLVHLVFKRMFTVLLFSL